VPDDFDLKMNATAPEFTPDPEAVVRAPDGGPAGQRGQHTDVYYASIWQNGNTNKVKVNDDNGHNDQFMPALDFDANGNLVVTFYDRRDDNHNIDYRLYRGRIDENGQSLQSKLPLQHDPLEGHQFLEYSP